jgi:hypothetical protein
MARIVINHHACFCCLFSDRRRVLDLSDLNLIEFCSRAPAASVSPGILFTAFRFDFTPQSWPALLW